jgi:small subunit ribosomal protein S2
VFVVDVNHDINAIREARKLNVPVIALVDTNADPSLVDYAIPCNDDAIRTLQLVADYLKQAIEAGKAKATKNVDKTE